MKSHKIKPPIPLKVRSKVIKKGILEEDGLPVKYAYKTNQIAEPCRVKRTNHIYNTLEEFTSTTTLHGFRYLLNKNYSRIERLWWLVMVVCSVLTCTFFIRQLWMKWNENPVVIHIGDVSSSVWHIPFPAVTLCSETKSRQRAFNFTKAFDERWSNPSPITAADLKLYNDMLLVCNNTGSDGPDYVNFSSIETLRKLAPSHEETFLTCKWGNYSCNELFFQTLTKDGHCFTFNMLSAEEMFRVENLHNDYFHTYGNTKSAWSLESGYESNSTAESYPFRGLVHDFDLTLLTDVRDIDRRCRGPVQGFQIWLHNPAELPHMSQNFFRLSLKYQSNVIVKPILTKTSRYLVDYSPLKRRCYFSKERYLKYFRTYTESNCRLECAANYTIKRCDCVPSYLPHGPNTKICGGGKSQCIIEALGIIIIIIISAVGRPLLNIGSPIDSHFDRSLAACIQRVPAILASTINKEELSLANSKLDVTANEKNKACGCPNACTELKYITEVSQDIYDIATMGKLFNPDNPQGRRVPSGLTIKLAKEKFTSMRRSELYSTVEFLAHCGGIMGLFIGFSILSLMEIVFYFTLRLWCVIVKND